MDRKAATDPDTLLTPNQLAQHLRTLSGGASPIGVKRLRAEIRAGRLRASRVGYWNWIRFGDFLDWLEAMQIQPEPTVEDRVDQRVKKQLRRETALPWTQKHRSPRPEKGARSDEEGGA